MEEIINIEEKQNPFFRRKEIKFILISEIAPNHEKVRKIISEKFSIPEENIRIGRILGRFGSNEFSISANLYESELDKLKIEGKSKKDFVKKEVQSEENIEEKPVEKTTENSENSKKSTTESVQEESKEEKKE